MRSTAVAVLAASAILAGTLALVSCGRDPAVGQASAVRQEPAVRRTPPPFPHQQSAIVPDPAVHWGVLPNGLRWSTMRNDQPRDRISLRLRVDAGSLMELDRERGLAHYLEHLAFKATTAFPDGKMVETLQKAGLAFGAHTNAHTSFDETVYKLDLPDVKPATLDLALRALAGQAGGMLLKAEDIEHERGVILAEMRDRDSPGLRVARALYAATYPGTPIPDRFPIGTKEDVSAIDAAAMRRFYERWYRPERMHLVLVGAIEPAQAEAAIRTHFGALAARAPAVADPPAPAIVATGLVALNLVETELGGTSIHLGHIRAQAQPVDTVALRERVMLTDMGERILARRLAALIEKDPQYPLLSAQAYSYRNLDVWHAGISGESRPGRALEATAALTAAFHQMLAFGPTASELETERSSMLKGLDNQVANAGNRTSTGLADAIYNQVADGLVFVSPAQDRDLRRPLVLRAEAARIRACMRASFGLPETDVPGALPLDQRVVVAVTGRESVGPDAETKLTALVREAWARTPVAPAATAALAWAHPVPAAVAVPALTHADDLHRATVAGLPILIKRTDFKPNQVLISLRLEANSQTVPSAVKEFAQQVFFASGTARHRAEELDALFAGSSVHLGGPGVDEDSVTFSVSCLATDVEEAFRRLAAHLDEPGWRAEAAERERVSWLEQFKALPTALDAQVRRKLTTLLVADDPARRPVHEDEARAVTLDQARAWLSPILADAPRALTIVGDLDPTLAAGLAARYLAQRPRTPPVAVVDPAAVAAALPGPAAWTPGRHRLDVPGTTARAAIVVAWPIPDGYDIGRSRRLGLLAQVLGERLREELRNRLGDAYSPYAGRSASDTRRDEGRIFAYVSVAPDRADDALAAVMAVAAELHAGKVTAEYLDRVRAPLLKSLPTQRRDNGWWLGTVLGRAAWQPFRIGWAETLEADLNAVTVAELAQLGTTYLDSGKAVIVVGVCQGKAAAKP